MGLVLYFGTKLCFYISYWKLKLDIRGHGRQDTRAEHIDNFHYIIAVNIAYLLYEGILVAGWIG